MTTGKRKRLGEILVEAGMLEEYQINAALKEQKLWGGKLGEHLIRGGYITEEAMLETLRNQLKIPSVNLLMKEIPKDVIAQMPEEVIRKHKALPVGIKNINGKDHLIIAMGDPANLDSLDELQFATKLKIMPALAGPLTLERALKFYLDGEGDLFSNAQENLSPDTLRKRLDISGHQTVTGEAIEKKHEKHETPKPPEPAAAPMTSDPGDLGQIRAELTALRDILLEKGILERKSFVERVVALKLKKS